VAVKIEAKITVRMITPDRLDAPVHQMDPPLQTQGEKKVNGDF
jgi:hypothetical protein